jgi:hypothetical protein
MQKALQGVRGNGNSGIHATIRKTGINVYRKRRVTEAVVYSV